MSNSLDPDQARHFVGPGLVPDCLEKISADTALRFKSVYLNKVDIVLWDAICF